MSDLELLLRSGTARIGPTVTPPTPMAITKMVHILPSSSNFMACTDVCLGFKIQYNRPYRSHSGQPDKDCPVAANSI